MFQRGMLVKSMQQLREKPLSPQVGRKSIHLLLRMSSQITTTTPTKKTPTPTKKAMKMLRKYREIAKMPKGWAHVVEDIEEEKVDKVWWKQKRALSDYTTPGINGV